MAFIDIHRGNKYRVAEFMTEHKANPTLQERQRAQKFRSGRVKLNKREALALGATEYAMILQMHEDIMDLPKIDLESAEQVRVRVREYFDIMKKYKQKPTLAGLCLALGTNRDKMKRIAVNSSGRADKEVSEILQQVYVIYESLWEGYMLNGDIPPLSGAFIGKNQFGYKDVVEQNTVVEVKPQIDTEAIKMKYIGADNELPDKSQKDKK